MSTFAYFAVFFIMWEIWKIFSIDEWIKHCYTIREWHDMDDKEKAKNRGHGLRCCFLLFGTWNIILVVWGGPLRWGQLFWPLLA